MFCFIKSTINLERQFVDSVSMFLSSFFIKYFLFVCLITFACLEWMQLRPLHEIGDMCYYLASADLPAGSQTHNSDCRLTTWGLLRVPLEGFTTELICALIMYSISWT